MVKLLSVCLESNHRMPARHTYTRTCDTCAGVACLCEHCELFVCQHKMLSPCVRGQHGQHTCMQQQQREHNCLQDGCLQD
jgi:hypothetical protein